MSLRRVVVIVLSVVGALLLAIVLYVAFADLGRHKGQVEAFATKQLGRPFAIDGEFELDVFPSVSVLAERVRIGNAEWGTKPQMLEVGRFSTQVGLWSLISGPVDVRSFELADVSVLLERNREGADNWTLSEADKSEEEDSLDPGVTEFPVVVQHAKLSKVEITYREPGVPDRVALLETLTIEPGTDGLLAIAGNGKLNEYRTKVDGHLGPIDSLFSGRNIRMKMQAAIERLQLDINGSLGRLDPLDGADLALKLEHPDLGGMLENLRLPVVATGTLDVDIRLKDAGELSQLDFDAKLGDIAAKASGTLKTLGLPGSDLKFDASVADAARLAKVFDVTDVPAERLTASGHVASSKEEVKFDGLSAKLAGAEVKADGTIRLARDRDADIRFELNAEKLMRLRKGLPDIALTMSGNFVESREKFELREFKSRIGKTEVSGSASLARNDKGKGRLEAELASPHLDLTPFIKKEADSNAKAQSAGAANAPSADAKQPAKGKYVFTEKPLALDGLARTDAKLHFVFNEVKLAERMLKDVDGTLTVDAGQMTFEGTARGGNGGTLDSVFKLKPAGDRAADVDLKLTVKDMRAGFGAGEGIDPSQVPPTSVEAHLRASGGSARQMASSANGARLADAGSRQGQERRCRRARGRHLRPARGQAESVLGAGPVYPAGLHRDPGRHHGRPGDGRARARAVGEGHHHSDRQSGSSYRRPHGRLQHQSARGHWRQPGNVYQSLHQARRDTREPEDCDRRQGRGIRCGSRCNRRRIDRRERARGPRPRRSGLVQGIPRKGKAPSGAGR